MLYKRWLFQRYHPLTCHVLMCYIKIFRQSTAQLNFCFTRQQKANIGTCLHIKLCHYHRDSQYKWKYPYLETPHLYWRRALLLKPEYFWRTRPIPWLLMPHVLVLLRHQPTWYWLCKISRLLYCMGKINYPWQVNVGKCKYRFLFLK